MSFFPNIYKKNASMRSMCGYGDIIQACAGCDDTCNAMCTKHCADDCTEGASDIDPGCIDCYGSCFGFVEALFGK